MMLVATYGASQWDRNTQADAEAGLQAPDPKVVQRLDAGGPPPTFTFPRVGFQGIRKELQRIVSAVMPGVPSGPPVMIARRESSYSGRPAVAKIKPAAQLVPVVGIEQTAPYWEYLQ